MNNFGFDFICKLNRQFTTEGLTVISDIFPELIEREFDYDFKNELSEEPKTSKRYIPNLLLHYIFIIYRDIKKSKVS